MKREDRDTEKYTCQYYHDGGWWVLIIDAYDWADAEVRAKRLGLQFLGKHKIRLPGWIGWIIPIVCWVQNLFVRDKDER